MIFSFIFHKAGNLHVIEYNSIVVHGSLGKIYSQSGIVELTIIIDDTAIEVMFMQFGIAFGFLPWILFPMGAEPDLACHHGPYTFMPMV